MPHVKKIWALILIPVFILSCHQRKDMTDNYFHQGFINDYIFQCIITVKPDNTAQGLVKKRESAYMHARTQLETHAMEALINYCLDVIKNSKTKIDPQEIEIIKENLKNDIKKIAAKGTLVMEYYNEDDSVVAVYRIKKQNLRNNINSIADQAFKKISNI